MTRRLLLSYLTVTVVVLLGLEIPFGVIYARGELSRFANTVERDAGMLAELGEEEIEEGNLAALPALVTDYARRTGNRVVIVNTQGAVLSDSGASSARGASLAANADIAAALRNQHTVGTGHDPLAGEVVYAAMPASSGPTIRGALRLTAPIATVTARIHDTWLLLAAIGLLVLVAVTLIGFTLARWITRPVRSLERATTQLADGTVTDPPAADLGPPELRRLAAAFTHTATRLQHLLQAQRSFAADASHQLKTPLTALYLRLENLEPDLHPRAHASLDAALAEINRLNRMVRGLLALARLEDNATTPEPTDLDATLDDRAASWAAVAAEHHVHITVTGPPVGPVWAIPGALEQILDNLLANALHVAPPQSTITLARAAYGQHTDVHVIDQGPGMTAAERERAFDRFWRASHASHHGSGLGLTIVARLTRASGGNITLHEAPRGGLDVLIRLATAPSTHHEPP